MPQPLVSFVVPVFNGEKYIVRCLRSIQRLQVPADMYEVVILDNGSTDRTPQLIQSLGFDFQVVPRVHVSVLRNRGAAIARGDYLAFVDSDVELTTTWLQNGLLAFRDRQVIACGCFPRVPDNATWVQRNWDIHQRGRQPEMELRPVPWLPSGNLIVSRSDFLAVSGFNEKLETVEDVDLCYRLGQRGVILCNPTMDAIHWGEAADLRMFWRKEVWRGKGNLQGVFSHGFRWDEVPSLGYPLYVICCVLSLGLGFCLDLWHQHLFLTPLSLGFVMLPGLILASHTAYMAERFASILALFMLYFIYGLARAYALIKGSVA